MLWKTVTFGKYVGMTLPEILVTDPDWFYWALPKLYGSLREDADELARRACAIKIPRRKPRKFEIEYQYDREGRFLGFRIVKTNSLMYSKWAVRDPHLNLLVTCGVMNYDKRSGHVMVRDFRNTYFGEGKRLTKGRCKRFFSDDQNFCSC